MSSQPTLFWHDYESFGADPRKDRPAQFAGIRTDLELNEIAEPVEVFCQPADDFLPSPDACLITGITPQQAQQDGFPEAEFIARVHQELSQANTCSLGYNTLRFDDELTRHTLYRNFYDAYGREWQNGNSRWDLIDVVRTAYALRPEGIVWPEEEGRVTLKLERLTAANGIDHGHAHDALSDVRATIALARLIREKQPKLYDYLFQLRSKHKVQEQIRLLQPLVHISGRFSAARSYLSVVLPLAWHPVNRNALIVCDLFHDHSPLLDEDGDTLRQRLYTRREDLAQGQLPVPLKLLHINKCPVVAPLSVLREEDRQRLQLDMPAYKERVARLNEGQAVWLEKLKSVYAGDDFAVSEDPEQQLYDGFINDRDRRLCEQVRTVEPQQLGTDPWPFDDPRLPELLFRYRARNFAETLNVAEQQRWLNFCQWRLTDPVAGAPNTLKAFSRALIELSMKATPEQLKVLAQWQEYSLQLQQRLGLQTGGR